MGFLYCRDYKCPFNKKHWPSFKCYCSRVEDLSPLIDPLKLVEGCHIPYIINV
jgi:hypothetical protein